MYQIPVLSSREGNYNFYLPTPILGPPNIRRIRCFYQKLLFQLFIYNHSVQFASHLSQSLSLGFFRLPRTNLWHSSPTKSFPRSLRSCSLQPHSDCSSAVFRSNDLNISASCRIAPPFPGLPQRIPNFPILYTARKVLEFSTKFW